MFLLLSELLDILYFKVSPTEKRGLHPEVLELPKPIIMCCPISSSMPIVMRILYLAFWESLVLGSWVVRNYWWLESGVMGGREEW